MKERDTFLAKPNTDDAMQYNAAQSLLSVEVDSVLLLRLHFCNSVHIVLV